MFCLKASNYLCLTLLIALCFTLSANGQAELSEPHASVEASSSLFDHWTQTTSACPNLASDHPGAELPEPADGTDPVDTPHQPRGSINDFPPVTKKFLLTPDNHVVIRGPITDTLVAKKIVELNRLEPWNNQVFIFLQSPGGSVTAGLSMIQQLQYLNQSGIETVCIGDVAISMAFVMFQYCTHRYTTSASIAMQHQMSLRLGDKMKNLKSRLSLAESFNDDLDEYQAQRIGLSLDQFRDRIQHDWWLYGPHIAANGVSDETVNVGCSHRLLDSETSETIQTPFGSVQLYFSACPLGRGPIRFNFKEMANTTSPYQAEKELEKIQNERFTPIKASLEG